MTLKNKYCIIYNIVIKSYTNYDKNGRNLYNEINPLFLTYKLF